MAETPQVPPWRSQKIWMAVLGIGALVALAMTGKIVLNGMEITAVVVSLILGRAHEGAAARRVE